MYMFRPLISGWLRYLYKKPKLTYKNQKARVSYQQTSLTKPLGHPKTGVPSYQRLTASWSRIFLINLFPIQKHVLLQKTRVLKEYSESQF